MPERFRPKYKTAFPISDDTADGGLFVYPDGEIRFWKPEPLKGETSDQS